MDEDSSAPRCAGGSRHGRFSAVCLLCPISLPAKTGAKLCFYLLRYGGPGACVTPLILWADRQIPRFQQATCPTSSGAFPSEPASHVCVRLSLRGDFAPRFGIAEWNGLLSISFLVDALRGMFLWNWLNYWLILGAWQAYRYYDHYLADELRLERLEKNFSEARLNALRMQLDPHFLFNALNTISSQLERDPKLARGMIEHSRRPSSPVAGIERPTGSPAGGRIGVSGTLSGDPEDSLRRPLTD